MRDVLTRLAAGLRMLVTRGRISDATFTRTRVLLQLDGLADETKDQVELLLPYGMSAVPGGGDAVLLAVCGSRAHLIALGGDDSSLRITDLQKTEFGWRDARGQQIVFRQDKLEITTGQDIDLTTTANVNMNVTGNVTVTAAAVLLGGTGGKKVALDGDPVVGGKVQATSTKVTAL